MWSVIPFQNDSNAYGTTGIRFVIMACGEKGSDFSIFNLEF